MNTLPLPTPQRLRQLFDYDAENGFLIWRHRTDDRPSTQRFNTRFAGKRAGCICAGYWKIKVDNIVYFAHRLIWVHQFGIAPTTVIDHVNGSTTDNRLENLREASVGQNCRNGPPRRGRKLKGAYKKGKRWQTIFKLSDGTMMFVGSYDTEEEAARAYDICAIDQYGDYCSTNFPRADYREDFPHLPPEFFDGVANTTGRPTFK